MLLEPDFRYFKQYDLIIGAKKTTADSLPLMSDRANVRTVETLLHQVRGNGKITDRSDRDLIELVTIKRSAAGNLVLFFHRDALKAADPSYRKQDKTGAIKVSKYQKQPDESQAVSCHLVISPRMRNGGYRCVLEEVPGLSMAAIVHTLRKQVFTYSHYKFRRPNGGKEDETYATIKAVGFQSDKLKESLKKARWNMVTLTRPPDTEPTDGLPWLKPKPQIMQIKVDAKLPRSSAYNLVKKLTNKAYDSGWTDVRVELDFDDQRTRSVAIDRDDLGRDILFVKSHRVDIVPDVDNCSAAIVPHTVAAAETLF